MSRRRRPPLLLLLLLNFLTSSRASEPILDGLTTSTEALKTLKGHERHENITIPTTPIEEEEEKEEEKVERELLPMERLKRAFGRNDYLLPENFKTLRRADIPVTYRLHDDLLRYYRLGTRPVTHPSKLVSVSMSVFLYQIVKLGKKSERDPSERWPSESSLAI
ncbi:unnamed protein product [Caenorhabditis auriculariae]|uniref:Uncharacterized protein n=1 Tax=Caenorhabditis auriculariae TaxID=2777116 RepID=A0A8S1H2D9_9PELO|nr:unnamed protein product [Caenorhabditis auriculariae]